ncbi:MAG: outer membrane lipid asymmetry maintenance protein MlaD [Rickettsiaceae bacterium]|nr:outer membrane lipid asymmetry maintenance protein MlaD [Rickettsiaceae bacterium]
MKQGIIETLVGFFVLIVAFSFFAFAYNTSNFSKTNGGYLLTANFQNIDGIAKGADVKLAGIKIGFVDSFTLEDDTYYAILNLKVNEGINIPNDSSAMVSSNGLFGGKYIRITPGASNDNFAHGGKIKFTQSSLNIEDLIGKLMYSITSK